jgi:uncharacterized protein YdaU (DUF1376 family)
MHYYQRHIGDYAKDTGHLTLLEHGVYSVLMDWSYGTERPLPDEKAGVYRICRATTAKEKKAVDDVVAEFFKGDGKVKFNKRTRTEISKFNAKSEKNSAAAASRWQSERNANALPPDGEGTTTRARVPLTNNQQPSEGGGTQVGDAEILQFGADWPGEMGSGTPPMNAEWLAGKIAVLNGRREWPRDWQRWLISCWRVEHRIFSAGDTKFSPKKNAGPVSASVEEISRQKKITVLSDEEDELAYEINSLRQNNLEVPPEKLERLLRVRDELQKLKF